MKKISKGLVMLGYKAIDFLLSNYEFQSVLDIGAGQGHQADRFEKAGKDVTRVDLKTTGDYMEFNTEPVDLVWACHVLEHQRNVGLFLDKMFADLKDGGILAITVPPEKPRIVGGHLTLWNAGLLLYNLVLAGFDCSEAHIKKYAYNISVIVKKKKADLPELKYDNGDLANLKEFFPVKTAGGFDGRINSLNWSR